MLITDGGHPVAQFQHDILQADVWSILLQRQDTAMLVPDVLAEFSKFSEFKQPSRLPAYLL
jgi:hypothetical protein